MVALLRLPLAEVSAAFSGSRLRFAHGEAMVIAVMSGSFARLTVVRTAFTGTLIATVVDSGHNATSLTHRAIFLLRAAFS